MTLQDAFKYNGKALGRIKCTYAGIYPEAQEGTAVYAIRSQWIQDNRSGGHFRISDEALAEIAEMYPAEFGSEFQNVATYDGESVLRIFSNAIVATDETMQSSKKFQACYLLEDAIAAIDKGMSLTISNWEARIKQFENHVRGLQAEYDKNGNIVDWYYTNPEWTKWKEQYDKLVKYDTGSGWTGSPAEMAQYYKLLANKPEPIIRIKRPGWYEDYNWELSHYKQVIGLLQAQADSGSPVYVKNVAIEWYPDFRDNYGTAEYERAYIAAVDNADKLKTLLIAAGAASLI